MVLKPEQYDAIHYLSQPKCGGKTLMRSQVYEVSLIVNYLTGEKTLYLIES
nr:hypothetical protein [Brevibacillus laterosporus]